LILSADFYDATQRPKARIVTLNRFEAKNALSSGMYRAWRMLDDDPALRVGNR
jgi:enoyl-CoA hydratase/carnithine racemase